MIPDVEFLDQLSERLSESNVRLPHSWEGRMRTIAKGYCDRDDGERLAGICAAAVVGLIHDEYQCQRDGAKSDIATILIELGRLVDNAGCKRLPSLCPRRE